MWALLKLISFKVTVLRTWSTSGLYLLGLLKLKKNKLKAISGVNMDRLHTSTTTEPLASRGTTCTSSGIFIKKKQQQQQNVDSLRQDLRFCSLFKKQFVLKLWVRGCLVSECIVCEKLLTALRHWSLSCDTLAEQKAHMSIPATHLTQHSAVAFPVMTLRLRIRGGKIMREGEERKRVAISTLKTPLVMWKLHFLLHFWEWYYCIDP